MPYDNPETGEVAGFDIEFKTAKHKASNFSVPRMFIFLAGELKEIFDSFAIVKASTTETTTTPSTTSPDYLANVQEGESDTTTAIARNLMEEDEDDKDSECNSSYPDDCILPW